MWATRKKNASERTEGGGDMKFLEDPRMKAARRSLAFSWIFFSLYLLVMLTLSSILGLKPYIFGLPRWVAVCCILVPIVFVILLASVVEKFIPDVPLADNEEPEGEE